MDEQQTVTLCEFNDNIQPITYLWLAGVGYPTGVDFRHWDQLDQGHSAEDYCDVNEVVGDFGLWDLPGTIVNGRWEWTGDGSPVDRRGNTIFNIKAN